MKYASKNKNNIGFEFHLQAPNAILIQKSQFIKTAAISLQFAPRSNNWLHFPCRISNTPRGW